jgi:hypothetical protein
VRDFWKVTGDTLIFPNRSPAARTRGVAGCWSNLILEHESLATVSCRMDGMPVGRVRVTPLLGRRSNQVTFRNLGRLVIIPRFAEDRVTSDRKSKIEQIRTQSDFTRRWFPCRDRHFREEEPRFLVATLFNFCGTRN